MTDLPTPAPKPASKSSVSLRILLAVSLMLNLAVAGFVIGRALDENRHGPRGMSRDMAFGPFTEGLSRDDRRALAASLYARAPEMRQMRKMIEADVALILDALVADPFDPAALDLAFAAQNDRMTRSLGLAQTALRDFLVGMTPQARAAFAASVQDHMGRAKGP